MPKRDSFRQAVAPRMTGPDDDDASIDVVFDGVDPAEEPSSPTWVPRSSGIKLLSKRSPALIIPERFTVPPLAKTRAAPSPDVLVPIAARAARVQPPAPPARRAFDAEARPAAKPGFDWRESNLARRPAAFNFAHGLLKFLAIVVGFAVTTLCLMACAGAIVRDLALESGIAGIVSLALPALVARRVRPKDDPLIALGLTGETYALLLLGFAVAFVIVAHDHTASLLANEGDRAARAGARAVAQAEWFLARVAPR
jgi:hypothetical protein